MLANEDMEICLQKLSKSQLIAMSLSQKNETKATIESLRDKVKPMNTNFKRIEANVSVAKAVNSISMKIQRQCWAATMQRMLTNSWNTYIYTSA